MNATLASSTTPAAALDKNGVTAVYSRIAPVYDLWADLTETKARRACLRAARIRDGESVLEIAVGTGLTFAEILRSNPSGRNAGVDLTAAMLERARRRAARVPGAPRFELAVGDAYALGFAPASFDVVVNNYMFDLLPEADFAAVLGEMRRVLRPGGRLVLVNMTVGDGLGQRVADWVYRVRPALMGGCRGVQLEPHVRAAGFEAVKRTEVSQWGVASEILTAVAPGSAVSTLSADPVEAR